LCSAIVVQADAATTSSDAVGCSADMHGVCESQNLYAFLDDITPECSDEFDKYLATQLSCNTSVSRFWDESQLLQLPNLYKPATSAGIERAFSAEGLILIDRRNRLNDDMFEQMLVAKLNVNLM